MSKNIIHLTTKDYFLTKEEFSLELDTHYDMLVTREKNSKAIHEKRHNGKNEGRPNLCRCDHNIYLSL